MRQWEAHATRLEAREQLRAIEAATMPHLEVEDQEETIDNLREIAGYLTRKEGGGYRDDVTSISLDDFRQEIKRGVF